MQNPLPRMTFSNTDNQSVFFPTTDKYRPITTFYSHNNTVITPEGLMLPNSTLCKTHVINSSLINFDLNSDNAERSTIYRNSTQTYIPLLSYKKIDFNQSPFTSDSFKNDTVDYITVTFPITNSYEKSARIAMLPSSDMPTLAYRGNELNKNPYTSHPFHNDTLNHIAVTFERPLIDDIDSRTFSPNQLKKLFDTLNIKKTKNAKKDADSMSKTIKNMREYYQELTEGLLSFDELKKKYAERGLIIVNKPDHLIDFGILSELDKDSVQSITNVLRKLECFAGIKFISQPTQSYDFILAFYNELNSIQDQLSHNILKSYENVSGACGIKINPNVSVSNYENASLQSTLLALGLDKIANRNQEQAEKYKTTTALNHYKECETQYDVGTKEFLDCFAANRGPFPIDVERLQFIFGPSQDDSFYCRAERSKFCYENKEILGVCDIATQPELL